MGHVVVPAIQGFELPGSATTCTRTICTKKIRHNQHSLDTSAVSQRQEKTIGQDPFYSSTAVRRHPHPPPNCVCPVRNTKNFSVLYIHLIAQYQMKTTPLSDASRGRRDFVDPLRAIPPTSLLLQKH